METPLIIAIVGAGSSLITLLTQYLLGRGKSKRDTEKVEVDIVREYREIQSEMEEDYQKLRKVLNGLHEENLTLKAELEALKKK